MQNEEKSKRDFNKLWLIPISVLVLCFATWIIPNIIFWIKYQGMPIAAQTVGFAPDCAWSGTAVAWIDKNKNGQREADEQPLPDVTFHVSDGESVVSDWKGEAVLMVWLPGCPEASFEVYPDTPANYALTTQNSLPSNARESERAYEFGFITLEGVPTATARPAPPSCTSYQIGVAVQDEISNIAIAANGTIWAATFGKGIVRYDSAQDTWVRYTKNEGLISNDIYSITPFTNGDIWFGARGGASVWNGSTWQSFTEQDGLINDEVFKIAEAPDQSIWFATEGGVSHFIPSSNSWINYTTQEGLADNFVTYIAATEDRSVWLPTATEGMTRLILPASENEQPKWITYSNDTEGANYVPVDYIDRIVVAPDGTYWFAGLEGLMQFDPKSEIWSLDENTSVPSSYINSFTFGPDGSIWVASGVESPVIYHLNNQKIWEIYDSRDGHPTLNKEITNEDGAHGIAVDINNNVWVATGEAVTRCVFK